MAGGSSLLCAWRVPWDAQQQACTWLPAAGWHIALTCMRLAFVKALQPFCVVVSVLLAAGREEAVQKRPA